MPERSYIVDCLASITLHMPQEPVLVVDSDSPDKSYMRGVAPNVIVADVGNSNYETGAWWYAYRTQPDEFFYFLHDSTILTTDLGIYRELPLVILGTLDTWQGCSPQHIARVKEMVALTDYTQPIPDPFVGAFGSMFFCHRRILDRLAAKGVDRIQPMNKFESECMERVWGIVFRFEFENHQPLCSLGRGEDLAPDTSPVHKLCGRRL